MEETDLHYPPESCPFCGIASAYPAVEAPLWSSGKELEGCVPGGDVDGERTSPASFVVLASRDVVAFLDILPMVGGEFDQFIRAGEGMRSAGMVVELVLRRRY
jgi:hypothetical protein